MTRGGRMFETEHFVCLWDLLSTIPTLENPTVSVLDEFHAFNKAHPTHSKGRIILKDRSIADASKLGLHARDLANMIRLLALLEHIIGARRIDDFFQPHFFETNFWCMWRTTFAFQNWHSAIELRRYFLCFAHLFDSIHTLSGTTYGDSSTVPPIIRDKRDGSWRLWKTLAKKADDFGRPDAFCGNIDETN